MQMIETTITADVGGGRTALVHIKRPEVGVDISQAEYDKRTQHCAEVLADIYRREYDALMADGHTDAAVSLWHSVFASPLPIS